MPVWRADARRSRSSAGPGTGTAFPWRASPTPAPGSVRPRSSTSGPGSPPTTTARTCRGKIVLVDNGGAYHRTVQVEQIMARGGAAMLYVSASPSNLIQTGSVRWGQRPPATIPAVTVGAGTGAALRGLIEQGTVTLDLDVAGRARRRGHAQHHRRPQGHHVPRPLHRRRRPLRLVARRGQRQLLRGRHAAEHRRGQQGHRAGVHDDLHRLGRRGARPRRLLHVDLAPPGPDAKDRHEPQPRGDGDGDLHRRRARRSCRARADLRLDVPGDARAVDRGGRDQRRRRAGGRADRRHARAAAAASSRPTSRASTPRACRASAPRRRRRTTTRPRTPRTRQHRRSRAGDDVPRATSRAAHRCSRPRRFTLREVPR